MMQNTIILIVFLIGVSLIPSFIIALAGFTSIRGIGLNPSNAAKIQLKMFFVFVGAFCISLSSMLVIFYMYVPK
jgi:hypothetical protein